MSRRILVVGGDAAGMSAANQALRTAEHLGEDVLVTVLERTGHTSYSACGMPYWVAGDVDDVSELIARTPEQHRAAGIDLRTGTEVVSVDLAARSVQARDGDGTHRIEFDELVWATGASPVMPAWTRPDGALPHGVLPLNDLDEGAAWLALLAVDEQLDVVVVGGGYIGVEMAEAAVRRGHRVTLLARSRVLKGLDTALGDDVTAAMKEAGVDVRAGANVQSLGVAAGRVTSITVDGEEVPADAVVVATGITPNTDLVRDQLPAAAVGASRGLRADQHGHVHGHVWAAGDCAEVRHLVTGDWAYLPLGTHANKQGRALGEAVVAGPERSRWSFPGALGTVVTRFEGCEVGHTGLARGEAELLGLDVVELVTRGTTASGYMPEAEPIAIKVTAERGTRRLLGVQVVGGAGAAKRVDAAAAVLHLRGTVDDLAWMDLSYAPPLATAWEVLQVAARRVAERLG
ncbi:MAG: FAD-dependent oxidoreductase [Nocardioides sp.]|uniref:FAD-dependent oxidoreductase n=1 Tax=Nocardioides sp. TaxID=35761 RepID=UPI003F04D0B9